VETVVPLLPGALGQVEPGPQVAQVGGVRDVDPRSVVVSDWLPLPVGADPAALAYEVYVVNAGLPVIYANTGLSGSAPFVVSTSPVLLHTQFAQLDSFGSVVEQGAWRLGSALPTSATNAVRFALRLDLTRPGVRDDALRVEAVRLRF
jgi:hypothetical protein